VPKSLEEEEYLVKANSLFVEAVVELGECGGG